MSRPRVANAAFALIFAAFAFLHLYRIASVSPTWDEGTDIGIIHCLAATHDPFACLDDISQTRLPFYVHAAVLAITPRIEAQYLVSVLASALTLLLLYQFARREFGVPVATMTAALYVLSPQLLASGRMLLTHSNMLFTLFTTVSFVTFYDFVRRVSAGSRGLAVSGSLPPATAKPRDPTTTPFIISAIAFGLATSCSVLGVFNGIFIAVFYAMTIVRERRASWLDLTFLPIAIATFFATSVIYVKPALLGALIHACTLSDVYPFWNYLGLGSPHAPWYFPLVVFVIKIGPWWLALAAICWFISRRPAPRTTQRAFLAAFAISLGVNFALKGFVFRYDAPHHQVQFYPLVCLVIAAVLLGYEFRRRVSPPLIVAIAACLAIQIYDVVRFFPNYLFYGSQYGDRFIGEFYGPAVMHAQDRGPVNAHIDSLLARDPNLKILVADHNALERPEPNFIPFTKRDPSARYDYAFVDRLFATHVHFPERDAYNEYLAANYVQDYEYDFPVRLWMYRVMRLGTRASRPQSGRMLPRTAGETPALPGSYTTYATANPTCAAIIIRYMWRQDGWFSVAVSSSGLRTMSQTVYAPQSARAMPRIVRNRPLPVRMCVAAPSGMSSQGKTKNGAIIQAARFTPNVIGSVRQPPARSPSMSLKSFVDAAPRRKSMNTEPMNHGSAVVAWATIVQPATFSRQPRGMAMVRFAPIGCALVRPSAGTE